IILVHASTLKVFNTGGRKSKYLNFIQKEENKGGMTMTVRICVNHLGFRPSDRKRAVVVATGPSDPREFEVREVGTGHIVFRGSVTYRDDPFGLAGVVSGMMV